MYLEFGLPGRPVHYQHDPVQTIKTSVVGAMNMLGLAKRLAQKFFKPQLVKSTETQVYHLNPRIIGKRWSIDCEAVMTRERGQRVTFLTTTASTKLIFGL